MAYQEPTIRPTVVPAGQDSIDFPDAPTGPYIHNGRLHATMRPDYLEEIKSNDLCEDLAGLLSGIANIPSTRYLCAAIAKHCSYCNYFRPAYDADAELLCLWTNFMMSCNEVLTGMKDGEDLGEDDELEQLRDVEGELTRETFAAVPCLFDGCFNANNALIQHMESLEPGILNVTEAAELRAELNRMYGRSGVGGGCYWRSSRVGG